MLPLGREVLRQHEQRGCLSCIPMSVEFVLKLLGKVPPDYFELQRDWIRRGGGRLARNDFREFDGQTLFGVTFRAHYTPPDRGDAFPLDELLAKIDDELASLHYVIVSLAVEPPNWHNYVIFNPLPGGEFEAVTKGRPQEGRHAERITDVTRRVRYMRGTDILTYD